MWLFFALLTPLFWSIVHVMDSHCVDEIFEKPWMGVVIGAITSSLIYLLFPFILIFSEFDKPTISIIFLGLMAGALIQISQAFYFKALSYSEAGIVSAYWNLTPALLPVASFILFNKILNLPQYFGIGLLIFSSVVFCLIDTDLHTRWRAFFLMLAASILQVAALLIEDTVYTNTNYFTGFYIIITGLIISGLLPLGFKRARNRFKKNLHILKPALKIFVLIEISNLFALATSQKAIDLGVPSLVAAVETSVPAYIFVLSLILLGLSSKIW